MKNFILFIFLIIISCHIKAGILITCDTHDKYLDIIEPRTLFIAGTIKKDSKIKYLKTVRKYDLITYKRYFYNNKTKRGYYTISYYDREFNLWGHKLVYNLSNCIIHK